MSMPTLARDYTRWRTLQQLVDLLVDEYETTTEALITVHFGGDPDALNEVLQTGLNLGPAPSGDNMRELLDLISQTSVNDFKLGYEDRDFVTRVRSHLVDALSACISGDLERLAESTNEAYRALDFITYKRKRTDKRDYHNPFANEKRRFEVLTARTSRLARAFDKVAVSA